MLSSVSYVRHKVFNGHVDGVRVASRFERCEFQYVGRVGTAQA